MLRQKIRLKSNVVLNSFYSCIAVKPKVFSKESVQFIELNVSPSNLSNQAQELNLVEEGNSSLGLKAEVSLPFSNKKEVKNK